MPINVSVSDQAGQLYSSGINAFGAGIGGGFATLARRRDDALGTLSRSDNPAAAGAANAKLRRVGGISTEDELKFLTGAMEGLAKSGTITAEELDKFHTGTISTKESLYTQAAAAETRRQEEDGMRREMAMEEEFNMRRDAVQHQQSLDRTDANTRANITATEASEQIKRQFQSEDESKQRAEVGALGQDAYARGLLTGAERALAMKLPPPEALEFIIRAMDANMVRAAQEQRAADPNAGYRWLPPGPNGEQIVEGPDGRPVPTSAVRVPKPPATDIYGRDTGAMPIAPTTVDDLLGKGLR